MGGHPLSGYLISNKGSGQEQWQAHREYGGHDFLGKTPHVCTRNRSRRFAVVRGAAVRDTNHKNDVANHEHPRNRKTAQSATAYGVAARLNRIQRTAAACESVWKIAEKPVFSDTQARALVPGAAAF